MHFSFLHKLTISQFKIVSYNAPYKLRSRHSAVGLALGYPFPRNSWVRIPTRRILECLQFHVLIEKLEIYLTVLIENFLCAFFQYSSTVVPPNSRNFYFADFLIHGFILVTILSKFTCTKLLIHGFFVGSLFSCLIRGFPNLRIFFLEPIYRELGRTTLLII